MRTKISLLVVVLIAIALTTSALALAPMGPPTAGLKTGQFRAGADYSYSNMDFKIDWGDGFNTAKDVRTNIIFANIGYGLTDDWEGFAIASSIMCKFNFMPAKELAKDSPFDG